MVKGFSSELGLRCCLVDDGEISGKTMFLKAY